MTNREKYKNAFSVLEPSDNISWEVKKMKALKKKKMKKAAVAAVAVVGILALGSGSAYAANIGGIQRQIQIWTHGEQTEATITFDGKGGYTQSYVDEDGNVCESGGGGVAYDIFGRERPLTEEELMEEALTDDLQVMQEDGKTMIYFRDQVIDITDKFEDGVCYIEVDGGDKHYYVSVLENGNTCISEDKFYNPAE